jgi:hypothetical protein
VNGVDPTGIEDRRWLQFVAASYGTDRVGATATAETMLDHAQVR